MWSFVQDFRIEVSVPLRQGTETAVQKYCTKPQNHTKVTSVQNIHMHCILATSATAIAKTKGQKPLSKSTERNPKTI